MRSIRREYGFCHRSRVGRNWGRVIRWRELDARSGLTESAPTGRMRRREARTLDGSLAVNSGYRFSRTPNGKNAVFAPRRAKRLLHKFARLQVDRRQKTIAVVRGRRNEALIG